MGDNLEGRLKHFSLKREDKPLPLCKKRGSLEKTQHHYERY